MARNPIIMGRCKRIVERGVHTVPRHHSLESGYYGREWMGCTVVYLLSGRSFLLLLQTRGGGVEAECVIIH